MRHSYLSIRNYDRHTAAGVRPSPVRSGTGSESLAIKETDGVELVCSTEYVPELRIVNADRQEWEKGSVGASLETGLRRSNENLVNATNLHDFSRGITHPVDLNLKPQGEGLDALRASKAVEHRANCNTNSTTVRRGVCHYFLTASMFFNRLSFGNAGTAGVKRFCSSSLASRFLLDCRY
jgi:hypothetical protein